MSLVEESVALDTDASGAVTRDVNVGPARLFGVAVEIGTLVLPTITLTDEPGGVPLLAITALATDARYNLGLPLQGGDGADTTGLGPPMVLGRIHIALSDGGATNTGRLVLLVER
ncbi:MAG TPA: hypothetical protein VNF73_02850, partial [Candidatus Saccharimonadales bacterium]|nr:hypothetical protein [Candidatus Saccharimonadales bacterium]